MGRMQGPDERLTRSQFKRREAARRRAQERGWAKRSGPVTTRHDPDLQRLQYLDAIAPSSARGGRYTS
jgi:hypothetical protein